MSILHGAVSQLTKVLAIREASKIERSHIVPHHGSYSNGFHQYNVAAMLLVLHPEPSSRLIRACMFHDVAERFVGDTPYTAKQTFPYLKEALQGAESSVDHILGINETLSLPEQQWLVSLDMVEFYLWCDDEIEMGNRNARTPHQNAWKVIKERWDSFPKPVQAFINQFQGEHPVRLSDYIEDHIDVSE